MNFEEKEEFRRENTETFSRELTTLTTNWKNKNKEDSGI